MKKFFIIFLAILCLSLLPIGSSSVRAQDELQGAFGISPGLIEEWFNPGESKEKTIYISNSLGYKAKFSVEIEDFEASKDPKEGNRLLGDTAGPYTLRQNIQIATKNFEIEDGENYPLKVSIDIPKDIKLPGLYGALLVKAENTDDRSVTKIIPRIGCLFYIGIEGSSIPSSDIENFKYYTAKELCEKDQDYCDKSVKNGIFEIAYKNESKAHISVFGSIDIKNIFGKTVSSVDVKPWYVMPEDTRIRELNWESDRGYFGRYTANLNLKIGRTGEVRQRSVVIWYFPWQLCCILIALILLVIAVFFYFEKHFRLIVEKRTAKRKEKKKKKK